MFIADLTIEDQVKHLRPRSQATFFFAIRSFFTVWGDSVVPVVVVFFLTRVGIDPSKSMDAVDAYGQRMLLLAWWGIPVVIAVLQLSVACAYTLHGKYLDSLRAQRDELVQEDMKRRVR
jgi:Na+/melibiose symporter-like transporter